MILNSPSVRSGKLQIKGVTSQSPNFFNPLTKLQTYF